MTCNNCEGMVECKGCGHIVGKDTAQKVTVKGEGIDETEIYCTPCKKPYDEKRYNHLGGAYYYKIISEHREYVTVEGKPI